MTDKPFAKAVNCPNCGILIVVLLPEEGSLVECPYCNYVFSIEKVEKP